MVHASSTMPKLSDPLKLPCGAVIPNRLAKAAMTEGLATTTGVPTGALQRLYGLWSDGGAGLLLSGNVLIDSDHLERCGNVVMQNGEIGGDEGAVDAFRKWTAAATRNGNGFWAQISHGGRQVQKAINPNPKAPSAVPLNIPGGKFGVPEAMTKEEIVATVESFAKACQTCKEVGFTGVQIHAAHGYLLSSFLNPRANLRTDEYGGSLENRAQPLISIIEKARERVGPTFPIAVKLNSADFQKGGFSFEECLQVVQWVEKAGVDLIEISGGNYEQGAMMNLQGFEQPEEQLLRGKSLSTKKREAYFLEFAKAIQEVVTVPLMVTGGFRSKQAMESALVSGGADLIGIGRPLCVVTDGPNQILNGLADELPSYEDEKSLLPYWLSFLKLIKMVKIVNGYSAQFWFYEQLELLGRSGKTNIDVTVLQAMQNLEERERKMVAERLQLREVHKG